VRPLNYRMEGGSTGGEINSREGGSGGKPIQELEKREGWDAIGQFGMRLHPHPAKGSLSGGEV